MYIQQRDARALTQDGCHVMTATANGRTPVSNRTFEVRVGNATIVVKPGLDPEVLIDIVRAQ